MPFWQTCPSIPYSILHSAYEQRTKNYKFVDQGCIHCGMSANVMSKKFKGKEGNKRNNGKKEEKQVKLKGLKKDKEG